MSEAFRPQTDAQVAELLVWAAAEEHPLVVSGRSSKAALGRPAEGQDRLDLSLVAGIVAYEPEELVLTAKAATPLAEIEASLTERGQALAWEPPNLTPLLGGTNPDGKGAMSGTLGGAVACNLSGPRRIRAGAARDHVLGFRAVSGRGEAFKAGGRVVKNVTGFDLAKLMAGSLGTLAALTEVTVRALPAPEDAVTVLVQGLSDEQAVRAMTEALQSPADPSAAAHLPANVSARSGITAVASARGAVTALRVEGPPPSVAARRGELRSLLAPFGDLSELKRADSIAFWQNVRDVSFFAADPETVVWRLSIPPADGARVVERILRDREGAAFYDWGGGLVWLALPAAEDGNQAIVRGSVALTGGHATLIRAPEAVRRMGEVFQPQAPALALLTRRIKEAFDPKRILNRGRMYAGV